MASSAETQWTQLDHQNHDFPPQPNGPQNPRRAGLILKGVVITVAIALLPFYPSIPPEFTKRTILTRWEFLQLVFIGILLCYGLFSRRRSDAADKENTDTVIVESVQNYVAKILHVSPVFDVEMETVSPELLDSGRKVLQSWSSLYSPTDPVVVRRDESLLFSVRNLKSNGVSDHEAEDQSCGCYGHDMHEFCGSCSVSTKESGRQSGEFSFNRNSNENLKGDHAVLPSPVPWRSRSGKMEEENSSNTGVEEPESLPALRSPIPWNSRPNFSNTPSPNPHPLSPATSASRPVSQTPPKPSSISKSTTAAADSSPLEIGSSHKQKSTRRELKQMAESIDDDRASIGNSARVRSKSFSASSVANNEFTLSERESSASENGINGRLMSKPESKNSHSESVDSSATAGKSVRTIRRSETSNQIRTCWKNDVSVSVPGEEKLRKKNKAGSANLQQEIRKNVAAAAEYVIVELPKEKQQIRDPTPIAETKKNEVYSDAYNAENSSKRSKSDNSSALQPPPLMMKRSLIQPPPPPAVELYEEYMSHWMKDKQKTYHIETHDDDEDEEIDDYSDHDDDEEDDQFEEAPALTSSVLPLAAEIDANEVDKKADEFIAKFREQIRLQRIESIKRATSSQNRKNKAIRTAGNVT